MGTYRTASCAALACALTCSFSAIVHAAPPDPFQDYEATKRGEPLPRLSPTETSSSSGAASSGKFPSDQWSALVGGRGSFSFTTVSSETFEGDQSNTTFFFRLTPSFLLYVIDGLELGVSTGVLGKSLSRENDEGSLEFSWVTEFSVGYALPLGGKAALVPNLGLGFYLGSNSRDLKLPGRRITTEESTSVAGFSGSLGLDVAFQPMRNLQLRSGLGLYLTAGSESIESESRSLGSTAFHVGIPVAAYYVF